MMISTPNLYVAKCCPYSYQILYLLYDLGIADLYNITFYRYWDQDDAKSTIIFQVDFFVVVIWHNS